MKIYKQFYRTNFQLLNFSMFKHPEDYTDYKITCYKWWTNLELHTRAGFILESHLRISNYWNYWDVRKFQYGLREIKGKLLVFNSASSYSQGKDCVLWVKERHGQAISLMVAVMRSLVGIYGAHGNTWAV